MQNLSYGISNHLTSYCNPNYLGSLLLVLLSRFTLFEALFSITPQFNLSFLTTSSKVLIILPLVDKKKYSRPFPSSLNHVVQWLIQAF